jgi:hypothetical protein
MVDVYELPRTMVAVNSTLTATADAVSAEAWRRATT